MAHEGLIGEDGGWPVGFGGERVGWVGTWGRGGLEWVEVCV